MTAERIIADLSRRVETLELRLNVSKNKPLSITEASIYLGRGPAYLYRIRKSADQPKTTGKGNKYMPADLDEWNDQRKGLDVKDRRIADRKAQHRKIA